MRKPRISIPPAEHHAVVSAYLEGEHTTALALRYNVTSPTISDLLRKHGVRIRSIAETNRMRAPIEDRVLIEMNERGTLSQREIADHFGVSLPTIERAFRRLGLKSKHGRGSSLEKNFFWKGGRRIDRDHYQMTKAPGHPHATKDGYVREHRLVMEKIVGRYLLPTEVVHHKDGNPRNNDPSNLELFSTHSEHLRHEWHDRWRHLYPSPQGRRRHLKRRGGANLQASENDADP